MDPIPNVPVIQTYQIRNFREPYIPIWTLRQPYLPNFDPITNYIGFPIVDMPGCVETHRDNRRDGKPWDRDLVNQDPKGSTTLCPNGQYPSYNAMDYEPEQLVITRETPPPPISPPPEPPDSPETPTDTKVPEMEVECPGPTQPRVGDLTQSGDEKVIGHEIQEINPGQKVCVVLYEPTNIADKYLPAPQLVTTTAVIATVATGSALLAKPLADLAMKVVKPIVKKVMTKIQSLLGKTPYRPTQAELRTNEYRKKKELLGINFAKQHQQKMKKLKKK